jgi:hypothetical protein
MYEPVATSSTKSEYNEACMTCMSIIHIHIHLNYTEKVEDEYKEDTPVDIYIYMDNRSAMDTSITFKDTNTARHNMHIFHFMKQHV